MTHMMPLDFNTLEALADLICGDSGPRYRAGRELPDLFRNAGLQCPDHDGTTRKLWTLERLREYNKKPEQIEKVILRLANPKEYAGKLQVNNEVVHKLNEILSVEGIEISLDGVTPKLSKIEPFIPEPERTMEPLAEFVPDFENIIGDPLLLQILAERWKEVIVCIKYEAYLAAIIMMGGLLEGVLLSVAITNPKEANKASSSPKDKSGEVKKTHDWTLNNLIEVSHECGWIEQDIKRFSNTLRDYRNLIHPWEQRTRNEDPDKDTCKICLDVVHAAINDLIKTVGEDTKKIEANL
jgi:hypothetical protein